MWCFKKKKKIIVERNVYINNPQQNAEKFPSNKTSTTKYTPYNFIFKNPIEQFRRLANFYFLLVVIIQLIPTISPLSPLASIFPLCIVLIITAVKDGYEDYKRYKADDEVNKKITHVLKDGKFVETRWMNVVVGSIVCVFEGEFVPADLVPLSCSNPSGDLYIETSNLDGESGNKLRQCISVTKWCDNEQYLTTLEGFIKTPVPNLFLESFDATFVTKDEREIALSEINLLLRGAKLQNTRWVYAFVVYTGEETKLVLNQQDAPSKFTHVERRLNKYILGLFVLILLLCVVSAITGLYWDIVIGTKIHYLQIPNSNSVLKFVQYMLTFFVLYSNIIPISLYVSMEFVKLCGSVLLTKDSDFYDKNTESGIIVKTSNLLEELGQVTHVFSDKTGTLTENKMTFRKCSINGRLYHCNTYDEENDKPDESEIILTEKMIEKRPEVHQFLLSMALNHNIVVKELPSGKLEYSSISPDEEALVAGISPYGYEFIRRSKESIVLRIKGQEVMYEILAILEFTSSRKRMSIIIRDQDGTIKLLCKGADNVIFEKLSPLNDSRLLKVTQRQVDDYSMKGLRTLCYAEREISKHDFQQWKMLFDEAQLSMTNRKEKVEMISDLIEKDLFLLGATAIEDQLQEEVPETLEHLLRAQIKVWVLTGDKQQTAICIGKSCKLMDSNTKLLKVNATSRDECESILESYERKWGKYGGSIALIIDGKSLSYALSLNIFIVFALKCSTVICCRVSPIQKAQVVAIVKKNNSYAVTLSIGDGANDVSMIQEADVGIGIRGKEGSQASRSADFSIAKFRYLKKLLFVHGRYTYMRVTQLIQYSFYKNIAFIIMQFYYAFFSGFSGQTLFDSWVISVFNLIFTSWPILIFAIFEKDVPEPYLEKYPQLYNRTQNNRDFNLMTFFSWTVNSIWHSLVFFFGTLFLWHPVMSQDGTVYDLWAFGTIAVTACVVTVTLRLAIDTLYWPWMMFVCSIGSVITYFLFLIVYGFFYDLSNFDPMYLLFINEGKTPLFWLSVLIMVIIATLPDFTLKWLRQYLYPMDWQIIREKIQKKRRKHTTKTYGSFNRV